MRKTSLLIVLIKNMNARYPIHLGSPSANCFPGQVCRGAAAGGGDVSGCVSLGRVSDRVFKVGRGV